jgi:predicted DNA-binding transcriptional regulator YafY
MYHPTTRLLTVLELLQTHGQMTGAELGARLEVDARTIRRYILMLQDMGIPIEAEMGRYGGYALRSGFKLPPMMFTNDEAAALILGLLAARQLGLDTAGTATEGTFAKLYRVLPDSLRGQIEALQQALTLSLPEHKPIQGSVLTCLIQGIHEKRQVHIGYRGKGDERSERAVDPYGVVVYSGTWYMIGYCHLREDTRVFRLDRIAEARLLDDTAPPPPEDFDSLRYLLDSIATIPDRWDVEVILGTTLEKAAAVIPQAMGVLTAHPDGVHFRTAFPDLDQIARYLAGWGFPVIVCEPPELRDAFERLAATLLNFARD